MSAFECFIVGAVAHFVALSLIDTIRDLDHNEDRLAGSVIAALIGIWVTLEVASPIVGALTLLGAAR